MKASFVCYLKEKYPEFDLPQLNELVSEQLLSPFQIPLSTSQIQQIRTEIQQYWKLRQWGTSNLAAEYDQLQLRRPENFSACMSYDFHIGANGNPELIEINTNASFLALGLDLYSFLNLPNVGNPQFDKNALTKMFQDEMSLSQTDGRTLSIIDEKPTEQRLYLEFLIYESLFKKQGLHCDILDISESEQILKDVFVYNRHTDFYLQEEKSKALRQLFNESKIQLSPNPYEYFLLADKKRLLDWNQQSDVPCPTSLLKVYDLGKEDKEFIWSERKNLFFKPKQSFGGKQAYKGASISRKVFESVMTTDFIAQQYSAAPNITFDYLETPTEYKYDLRCFAYKDELQMIVARIYQGQTTNLRTTGGGFAAITLA
ncbi:hypothetical protein [Pseudobdellovibrio exovorus]|uniref:Glutathionylspermidine synthase pre-ATP-grasp-like domain-containing protein n=1 Tax=Pseudobdellovibrio exovorus JSS TaxID=1184267 RepID=M4VD93_9BACT|nr:hypothetical protein [Pseudobdellovibrio exovorus]AGH96460.1 hypothetical protein A11Q_2244 [Pseudobdellovibrio exovorus JSS]